jgi:hypothetical protein
LNPLPFLTAGRAYEKGKVLPAVRAARLVIPARRTVPRSRPTILNVHLKLPEPRVDPDVLMLVQ